MSTPPTLTLPSCATASRLVTARGEFAMHDARPAAGPVRGTALLVPGFTGSKEDFIALLEPLATAGFRVVAVDGRGQYET
ncbi:alpha/beta hydrolase, partial [Streptomyces palmae]